MQCAYHVDVESVAFCVACGRALCAGCRRDVQGSVYCETCLADMVRSSSGSASGTGSGGESPGVAFALGLIPGVGAIYNGEFFKAAIHIVIFGVLISLSDMGGPLEPMFGLLVFGFYMYMPFEAYYAAKKRKLRLEGVQLETPVDRFHEQLAGVENWELWGGVALVVVGGLFLLDNFRIFPLRQILPVALIAIGVWRLSLYSKKRNVKNKPPEGDDR
jgi:hypothetical protein